MTVKEEIMAEFRKKFYPNGYVELQNEEKLANDLKKSLSHALDRMEREAKIEGVKMVELPVHDHSRCPIKETCIGYQNAESDLENEKEGIITTLQKS